MSLEALYQEIILDHYHSPRGKGPCANCDLSVHQDNPLCGDEIDLHLQLSGESIGQICFDGHGCAISLASASMMIEAVAHLPIRAALRLAEQVRQLMHGAAPSEELGDLAALAGVAKFPVRIKCALLPWTALGEALAGRITEESQPS
jgi:nitrogen fixation protein NifU and related proteins